MINNSKMLFLGVIFVILVFVLSSCSVKTTDHEGIEREVSYDFVVIRRINGNYPTEICYDPNTMVCYLKIMVDVYRFGLSPYYIIGADGEPEIAVYGVNYN